MQPVTDITPAPVDREHRGHPLGAQTAPDRRAVLRRWLKHQLREDGWLSRGFRDVRDAPDEGWDGMANWVRGVILLAATLLGAFAAFRILQVLFDAAPAVWAAVVSEKSGIVATVARPLHDFLTTHSAGLPVSADTVREAWLMSGLIAFLLSGIFRAGGPRLAWIAWGAATVAMVWSATPDPGRPVAAGIAAVLWAFLSLFALCGMSLRPSRITYITHHTPPPEVTVTTPPPVVNVPAPVVKRVDINGQRISPVE